MGGAIKRGVCNNTGLFEALLSSYTVLILYRMIFSFRNMNCMFFFVCTNIIIQCY